MVLYNRKEKKNISQMTNFQNVFGKEEEKGWGPLLLGTQEQLKDLAKNKRKGRGPLLLATQEYEWGYVDTLWR